MKITQAQRALNYDRLLKSAVEVMTKEGFRRATMREIAQKAQLSEPAIYNYFPTKESILFGYFQNSLEKAIEVVRMEKEFSQYTFSERIQSLLEHQLEQFGREREFVTMAYQTVFVSCLGGAQTELRKQRQIYVNFVKEALASSHHNNEPLTSMLDGFVAELFWDFNAGIVFYWLNDKSPGFSNTTQLIDKSLLLIQEVLRGQLLSRSLDVIQFLVRQHLFSGLSLLGNGSDSVAISADDSGISKGVKHGRRSRKK